MANLPVAKGNARLDPRLQAVLKSPLHHAVMTRMAARPWCASEVAAETDWEFRQVSKAIEVLKKRGLLEFVRKEVGPKGGWLYFYRASGRFLVDADQWGGLTMIAKAISSAEIIADLHRDMEKALEAGTFYAHDFHTMIRDHQLLDDEGLERSDAILNRAYQELLDAVVESLQRSREQGTELYPVGFGLAAFQRAPELTTKASE